MSGDSLFYKGFLVAAATVAFILGMNVGASDAKQVLKECEKNLPRNENCVIVAVPVDKN